MKLKRFTARTSREALAQVRHAFGEDAVVMSTRPCEGGVEMIAMPADGIEHLEKMAAPSGPEAAAEPAPSRLRAGLSWLRPSSRADGAGAPEPESRSKPERTVEQDVTTMAMSTLSFQDYVRERMIRRRQAEQDQAEAKAHAATRQPPDEAGPAAPRAARAKPAPGIPVLREVVAQGLEPERIAEPAPVLQSAADHGAMMDELRSVRDLIEQRFSALAFMDKLQREPRQAQLAQRLLDCGFSPQLVKRVVASVPQDGDAFEWAAAVIERNLQTCPKEQVLEERGGTVALIGATGVGKTTSAAKLAAAFAARHGPSALGLITLDAYRIGAHEQLRQYGRIIGVPVHTAHDRASLEDLLELLSGKKMVLIDTAGTAQRDTRTRELLDMLALPSVRKVLVMNAAAQGETFEDVLAGYDAASCEGVVLSKIDEAVKLGPALDALVRHKLTVLSVANGQRVPEDWHQLSARALVQRALRCSPSAAWRMESADVQLVLSGLDAGTGRG